MKTRIDIITSEILKDFISNILEDFRNKSYKELNIEYEYEIHIYSSFSEILDIYEKISNDTDGILVSGIFIDELLRKKYYNNKTPIVYFNSDDGSIYKLLLSLINNDRNIDLTRVYVDLFGVFNMSINDYLELNSKYTYSDTVVPLVKKLSLDRILEIEKEEFEKHVNMWEQGLIDVSITRFSHFVPKLIDEGITVFFPYPGVQYIELCITLLLQKIKELKMEDGQFASIVITINKEYNLESEHDRDSILLHEALIEFSGKSTLDYSIKKNRFGFEILTDRKTVEKIINNYSECTLSAFLKNKFEFNFSIGYGIGNNMYEARMNAINANRESSIIKKGSSFFINENGDLIGPLGLPEQINLSNNISSDVRSIANNANLSSITVGKIINSFYSKSNKQLTARELSTKLSITQRSANRYLTALEKSGVIEVIATNRTTTKGRPERIYELNKTK